MFSALSGKLVECEVQDFVPIVRPDRFALPVVHASGSADDADSLPGPVDVAPTADQVAAGDPLVDGRRSVG